MPDGPGSFRQDSSCPALLRVSTRWYRLRVQDYHLLWPAFPYRSTSNTSPYVDPTTPVLPKQNRFGLFPFRSPLLRKSLLFSLPPGTEMFQFPGLASGLHRISRLIGMGCPIRTSTDQRLFAPPRGFSQLITSFFASGSQGIPRTLLVTFFFESLFLILSYNSSLSRD